MSDTARLIEELARSAAPVRRLAPPPVRLVGWLASSLAIVGVGALAYGVRSDLSLRLAEPEFALRLASSLATAALAGLAAFNLSLPDRSGKWLLLPLPPLVLWLSTLGYGCLADWIVLEPGIVTPGRTLTCFGMVVATSVPIALLTLVMLRHAGPIRPGATLLAAATAVAALAASFVSLLHEGEATVLTLEWNAVAVAVALGVSRLLGGFVLRPAPRR